MTQNVTYGEDAQMQKLNSLLTRYSITIADANDLVQLQGYEIVFLVDDSGSMSLSSVPSHLRRLGQREPTRWDELGGTVQMVVEIATIFDADGVDVFFLNREPLRSIKSRDDPRLTAALAQPPSGGTPLTEQLQQVIMQYAHSEKPVLILIATDGTPNGGLHAFKTCIRQAIAKRGCSATFKFQILACTDDDSAIGWLNEFDEEFAEVDVTDDYHSERAEVLKAERAPHFTRGDWLMKALLGPIISKFDDWDEPNKTKPPQFHNNSHPPYGGGPQTTKKKNEGCCSVQ